MKLKPVDDGRRIERRAGGCKQFGASNEPRTCLWCGDRLRKDALTAHLGGDFLGAYADDAFCTLRCGYAFGVNAARLGLRLEPRSDGEK